MPKARASTTSKRHRPPPPRRKWRERYDGPAHAKGARARTAAAALAAPVPVPRRNRQRLIESLAGCGFAVPAFILLLLTNLVPLAALLYLSFTDYELGAIDTRFLGLDNF